MFRCLLSSGKMTLDHELGSESEEFLIEGLGDLAAPEESLESLPPLEENVEALPPPEEGKKSELLPFSEFLQRFNEENSSERKISLSLEFMRGALASGGTPRFKDFWEGRKLCLPLFKESIPAKSRSQLWSEYIELSTEAKRLKEILDEQSAFAIEQIELAIQALERDLEHFALLLQSTPALIPKECFSLRQKAASYNEIQNELNLLNTLATRINGLRKEIVKTEMRIRIKNRLLERLSHCGDQIFPKRKELIKKLSREFIEDVQYFLDSNFREEELKGLPLYALREEIKHLQSIAKILTLNTQAFTETRQLLSRCWDRIRNEEKEKKREFQEKRQLFKQNFDSVLEKIKGFKEKCESGLSMEECDIESSEILQFMKTIELGREEVRALREELFKAKSGPLERARELEEEKRRQEKQAEIQRREKIETFKHSLQELARGAVSLDVADLIAQKGQLLETLAEISLTKGERHLVDRLFKQIKDVIDEKRQKALLNLSDADLQALDQLKSALEEKRGARAELKNQLEQYRKILGGSGFDFEKAMLYREMIEEEKGRLDKLDSAIGEIEEKIDEIEG